MLLTAAKTYLATNHDKNPVNNGDTIQIKLSELQANNFIDNIKDPNDSSLCGGYVLVTKITDTKFDYSPHLKCPSSFLANDYVEDGLLGHWRLNGNAFDYTPNNNHGVVSGANSDGLSYTFDGVDDVININNMITIPNDLTIAYWVKPVRDSDYRVLNGSIYRFSAPWHVSSTRLEFDDRDKSGVMVKLDITASVPTNKWTHVVVTRKGNLTTVYINGEFAGSTTGWSEKVEISNIGFKTPDTTACAPFAGSVYEVKAYNRALAVDEVKHIFNIENR